MKLFYQNEVELEGFDILNFDVWENKSLPMGNGYFGVSELSRGDIERLQITENSLSNPYHKSLDEEHRSRNYGVQSFCDIFLYFDHRQVDNFSRTLSLDRSLAEVTYEYNNKIYKRTTFASHSDRVLVSRINAPSFKGKFEVPFIGDYCRVKGDGFSRSVQYQNKKDTIIFVGNMSYYNIDYVGAIKILTKGGKLLIKGNEFEVINSQDTIILFTCLTNYRLDESVFLIDNPKEKLVKDPTLLDKTLDIIDRASQYNFEQLYERHYRDYSKLYSRVELSFGEETSELPTNKLIENYKNKKYSRYLETLLFQYGRYLLICSSREDGLPANLQGIWSAYDSAPWSAGYWHNINVQMNYWMVGPANLLECFIPYINYHKAYLKKAHKNADEYVKELCPEKYEENHNGWIIGTGAWPYAIEGMKTRAHSGPAIGALTALLLYDYYEFSLDNNFLKEVCYPSLYDMSLFLFKSLTYQDGYYLIQNSASPENIVKGGNWNDYYVTVGCAFDQQLTYENFSKTIELSNVINNKDSFITRLESVIDKLDPVIIGESGQIKEYREEKYYADIGEEHHRHISHLLGLYPGTSVSSKEEWINGAITTLNLRGDESTGWATAHRLCLWSRTKNASRTMDLIHSFISNNVLYNLWDSHPPFQIDGNFGYTAGICEMLLQSQNGYIELLPTLPNEWKDGYFKGLKARGNFDVNCKFNDSKINLATIKSNSNRKLVLLNKNYSYSVDNINYQNGKDKYLKFDMKIGDILYIKSN